MPKCCSPSFHCLENDSAMFLLMKYVTRSVDSLHNDTPARYRYSLLGEREEFNWFWGQIGKSTNMVRPEFGIRLESSGPGPWHWVSYSAKHRTLSPLSLALPYRQQKPTCFDSWHIMRGNSACRSNAGTCSNTTVTTTRTTLPLRMTSRHE